MANTRRKEKQRRRRTQRAGKRRHTGGENTGLNYLLFGDKTQHKPLTISQAVEAGALRPLKEQVKQRYAAHNAAQLGEVIKMTKGQIASSLQDVKTMPELMHEVSKTLDALISELSQKGECLSEQANKLLTQLVFITSSDTILGSLEEVQKEKAAAEKAAAEKAAAVKAAAEKAAAEKAAAEKAKAEEEAAAERAAVQAKAEQEAKAEKSKQEGQPAGMPPQTETV